MKRNEYGYDCSLGNKLMALARIFKDIATMDDNPELALIKSRYFRNFQEVQELLNLDPSDRRKYSLALEEDYNINDYCIAPYDRLEGYTHHVTLLMTLSNIRPLFDALDADEVLNALNASFNLPDEATKSLRARESDEKRSSLSVKQQLHQKTCNDVVSSWGQVTPKSNVGCLYHAVKAGGIKFPIKLLKAITTYLQENPNGKHIRLGVLLQKMNVEAPHTSNVGWHNIDHGYNELIEKAGLESDWQTNSDFSDNISEILKINTQGRYLSYLLNEGSIKRAQCVDYLLTFEPLKRQDIVHNIDAKDSMMMALFAHEPSTFEFEQKSITDYTNMTKDALITPDARARFLHHMPEEVRVEVLMELANDDKNACYEVIQSLSHLGMSYDLFRSLVIGISGVDVISAIDEDLSRNYVPMLLHDYVVSFDGKLTRFKNSISENAPNPVMQLLDNNIHCLSAFDRQKWEVAKAFEPFEKAGGIKSLNIKHLKALFQVKDEAKEQGAMDFLWSVCSECSEKDANQLQTLFIPLGYEFGDNAILEVIKISHIMNNESSDDKNKILEKFTKENIDEKDVLQVIKEIALVVKKSSKQLRLKELHGVEDIFTKLSRGSNKKNYSFEGRVKQLQNKKHNQSNEDSSDPSNAPEL